MAATQGVSSAHSQVRVATNLTLLDETGYAYAFTPSDASNMRQDAARWLRRPHPILRARQVMAAQSSSVNTVSALVQKLQLEKTSLSAMVEAGKVT